MRAATRLTEIRSGSNDQDGIAIASGTGNRLVGNSITANVQLGIDLGNNGATANDVGDADTGANNLTELPRDHIGSQWTVRVELPLRRPSTALRIQPSASSFSPIYRAGPASECKQPTSRPTPPAPRHSALTSSLPTSSSAAQLIDFITATATDPNGNTSELSPCVRVSDMTDLAVTLTDTPDPVQIGTS